MFTRRRLIASAASVLVVTPAYAQTDTPFVLPPEFEPQYVRVKGDYTPGQILIVPQTHFLYLITDKNKAIRYAVGVGKAGLDFQGSAIIQVKKEWPSWRPTDEMIERSPQNYLRYKDGMPGGPTNPLGARALYLFKDGYDTFYRIHGTTEPKSIGRSVSNGCIRMLNSHVIDLYDRVPIGTPVTVF
jgi:lipoprotein-anchoring transpeptidase ErfK/SrfK